MKKRFDDYPDIISAKELAELLNIGYTKALVYCKSGHIPCIRVGHTFKVPKKALIEWINQPGYREM